MASDPRPSGTGTEQNFNSKNETRAAGVFGAQSGDGSGYAERGRQAKVEFDRLSYMNLLQMKEANEEALQAQENIIKALEENKKAFDQMVKDKTEKIKKGMNAAAWVEFQKKEEELNKQKENLESQLEAQKKITAQYEEGAAKLNELYSINLETFEKMQKATESAAEILNQVKEADKIIDASIRAKRKEEQELHGKWLDLKIKGAREEAEIAKKELESVQAELADLKNSSLKNRATARAKKRELWAAGLNEDGSRRTILQDQEQGVMDTINSSTASLGARIGGRFGVSGLVIGTLAGAAIGGKISGQGAEDTTAEAYGTLKDLAEDPLQDGIIPEQLEEIVGKLGPVGEILQVADSVLEVASAIRKQMTQYIDQAAEQMKGYFGQINANLESSAYSYKAISEKADNFLTSSRWVKQTDYLNKIAEVSNAGLLRDIETAAILETIKEKTVGSFDTANAGIQRLIRLNESDYIRQFGIEASLKKVLNSVFNDSGYLRDMFDSVTEAIMDAASMYQGDVTAFNSTVQTWMGFMYSSGLSSNVINQIAEGINNLGSGNLTALSGNEQTQRLFLLAMDRVGMDYADILQQGLSLDDTNTLLSSIVSYLDEIVNNTGSNNVLRSSYANLFNLSMSDMRALHQLSSQASSIANYAVGTGQANMQTISELTNTLMQSTSMSEEFDNLIANFQYTLGESIAESPVKYSVYRIAEETMKVYEPFVQVGGPVGTIAKAGQKIAAIAELPILALGLVNAFGEFSTSFANNTFGTGLTAFLSSSLVNDINTSDTATLTTLLANANSTSTSNSAQLKTINRTTLKNGGLDTLMNTYSSEELNAEEEEGKDVKILTEMAKTLMQTKEEGHYAFAVSLEGMNDNVLRSFASIFADEDAMENTFTGENAAIKDSLFNYLDDTTSNSNTSDAAKAAASGNVSQSQVDKLKSQVNGKKK